VHLLNSIGESVVVIPPSNNPVCPQKAFARILLPIILGPGCVQTAGRTEQKTENSLCVILMPLLHVPSTDSRSNKIGIGLFLALSALPNAHLELQCKAHDKEGKTVLSCLMVRSEWLGH